MTMPNFKSARDLGAHVRDVTGFEFTDAAARDAMHAVGVTRYEEVDAADLEKIITTLLEDEDEGETVIDLSDEGGPWFRVCLVDGRFGEGPSIKDARKEAVHS